MKFNEYLYYYILFLLHLLLPLGSGFRLLMQLFLLQVSNYFNENFLSPQLF